MTVIPELSSSELQALAGSSTTDDLRILWAARLQFPGVTAPQTAVVAWIGAGYQKLNAGADSMSWWHGWRCTLCGDKAEEDCIHSSTARRIIIAEVREEARVKFVPEGASDAGPDSWKLNPAVAAEIIWWFWNEVREYERCVGQVRQHTVWVSTLRELLDLDLSQYTSDVLAAAFSVLNQQKRLSIDVNVVCPYL